MKKQLIVEYHKKSNFIVQESQANVPEGMMRCEGVFAVVDKKNVNDRYYTNEEYSKHITEMKKKIEYGLLGEMEHPKTMNINLEKVSHKIESIYLDEASGEVRGTILLLDEGAGKIAQAVVRAGVPLRISSRGVGIVESDGKTRLDEMATFDLVGTPGFAESGFKRVSESADVDVYTFVDESADDKVNMLTESFEQRLKDLEKSLESQKNSLSDNVSEALKNISFKEMIQESLGDEKIDESSIINKVSDKISADVLEYFKSENTTQSISEEQITSIVEEQVATATADTKSWVESEFSVNMSEAIQEWIKSDYTAEISEALEAWIKSEYSNEFSETIQEWVSTDHTKDVASAIQEWIKSDYTKEVAESFQTWVENEYTPEFSETIQEWSEKELVGQIEEGLKSKAHAEVVKTMPKDSKNLHEALEHIKNNVEYKSDASKELNKNITENADNTAPLWVELIPKSYGYIWENMTQPQRMEVAKLAAPRELTNEEQVSKFWSSLSINSILNVHENVSSFVKGDLTESKEVSAKSKLIVKY